VDFKTKCVFNGSDLGKEFSAKGLMERCTIQSEKQIMQSIQLNQQVADDKFDHSKTLNHDILKTIDDLMKPELNQNANEPFEQKRFKKKKRLKQ
jgi:hypothetical protein